MLHRIPHRPIQLGAVIARAYSRVATAHRGCIVGIKRETVNPWESRTPLTPEQVSDLVTDGARVLVQPSNRRCFTPAQFEAAGATIQENLEEASLIMGVKRPAELGDRDLLPDKVYSFFSHTIKGQPNNMLLLDTLLSRNIRLIDYECMVDETNTRLVGFGRHAGISGTIDILHGLGMRLMVLGHYTPFLKIGMAHSYSSFQKAAEEIRLAGYEITLGKMPTSIGPLTFVINGRGNVSKGAQMVLNNLPVEYVRPESLKDVCVKGDMNKIYVCIVNAEDHMVHREGKPGSYEDYLKNPELYQSRFASKIARYTSVLINATYWDAKVPRSLDRSDAKQLFDMNTQTGEEPVCLGCPHLPHRLIAISDISADLNGAIEFTDAITTVDEPFCLYNPNTDTATKSIIGDGILMCSIDNMPAQLGIEASEHFSKSLSPYLSDMLNSDATQPLSEFKACDTVKNACITSNSDLTPRYKYIEKYRMGKKRTAGNVQVSSEKSVLILGTGFVVPSLIEYLSRSRNIKLSIASNMETELSEVTNAHPHVSPHLFDVVRDDTRLSQLIREHDLVISMIPWKHHPVIATACVKAQKNLLTSSYCTPELENMAIEFENSGITAFMEIGLDPGIDHLLARSTMDDVAKKGGKVVYYQSFTGGLPAPEYSDNPLRYKFSWSPEAALSTIMNGARFLKNGTVRQIPADGSLMKMANDINVFPGFNLEVYPNRDSMKYISRYGLENCETVMRGTLRYKGFCAAASLLVRLGLLSSAPQDFLQPGAPSKSWRQVICHKLQIPDGITDSQLRDTLSALCTDGVTEYECLQDLGLLSNDPVAQTHRPISSTADQLAKKLHYRPHERDMIIMAHEVVIKWPDMDQQEVRKDTLVVYGDVSKGRSGMAMSRTVGLPAAIAAKMILDGEVPYKGIVLPLKPDLYGPILRRLKDEGIQAHGRSFFTSLDQ